METLTRVSIVMALLLSGCSTSFEAWQDRLPAEAKAYRDADARYWRLWYERGYSPGFAWRNTDPASVHAFSRPKLPSELQEAD
jgi:hypothetical protein